MPSSPDLPLILFTSSSKMRTMRTSLNKLLKVNGFMCKISQNVMDYMLRVCTPNFPEAVKTQEVPLLLQL